MLQKFLILFSKLIKHLGTNFSVLWLNINPIHFVKNDMFKKSKDIKTNEQNLRYYLEQTLDKNFYTGIFFKNLAV